MGRDVNKLNFYSGDPIDKIVAEGTIQVTNDGNTTLATGTGDGPQTSRIVSETLANDYGKSVYARFVWSTDGISYNSSHTHLVYSFTITFTDIPVTSSPMRGLESAVSIGVSDSTIYFRTANGHHGNVSTTSGNPLNGYTPISKTFTIKYALFEKE